MCLHIRWAIFSLGAAFLTGCSEQPAKAIQLDNPIEFEHAIQNTNASSAGEEASLDGYSLFALTNYALDTSPTVHVAHADFSSARYDTDLIEAQNRMNFGLNGEVMTGSVSDNTISLDIKRTVSSFGRIPAEIDASRLSEAVSSDRIAIARLDVEEQLIDYYFDWWIALRIKEVREDTAREANSIHRTIEQQADLGLISGADRTSAALQVDRLERLLRNAEMGLSDSLSDLSFFVGADLNIGSLRAGLPTSLQSDSIQQADIDAIVESNIRLTAFEQELASTAAHQVQVSLSNRPTITAVGRITLDAPFSSSNGGTRQGIGLSLDVPLTNRAQIDAQLGGLAARTRRLEAQRRGRRASAGVWFPSDECGLTLL